MPFFEERFVPHRIQLQAAGKRLTQADMTYAERPLTLFYQKALQKPKSIVSILCNEEVSFLEPDCDKVEIQEMNLQVFSICFREVGKIVGQLRVYFVLPARINNLKSSVLLLLIFQGSPPDSFFFISCVKASMDLVSEAIDASIRASNCS